MTKESDIKFARWLRKNTELVENDKIRMWQYKNQRYNTDAIWHIYRKEQLK